MTRSHMILCSAAAPVCPGPDRVPKRRRTRGSAGHDCRPTGGLGNPMNYAIQGRNLEMLRVELDGPDDTIIAQVGSMIYRSPSVSWRMTIPGKGVVGKLSGSLQRRMSGETAIQCHFSGPGEVGFGGTVPGTIAAVDVAASQAIIAQRGGFLAASPTVGIGIAAASAGVSVFGGENIVLQNLTGPGTVFLHAAGDFVDFDMGTDEEVSAELGSMVYYDSTVDYTIRHAGGLGTALLGGEGIVLAHFVGPGRVTLQTMAHWRPAVRARRK